MAKGVNQIINNIRLRKLRKILNQINALSEEFSNFSDEALQAKTKEFRSNRYASGEYCRNANRRR